MHYGRDDPVTSLPVCTAAPARRSAIKLMRGRANWIKILLLHVRNGKVFRFRRVKAHLGNRRMTADLLVETGIS